METYGDVQENEDDKEGLFNTINKVTSSQYFINVRHIIIMLFALRDVYVTFVQASYYYF